jgi:quinol-cytochrome oxidoreductase complex cytochrome b subunit/coenzyme F420-reducing hydrogenase delta subunit
LGWLRKAGSWLLTRVELWFGKAFGADANPFHHLGALTIFFFWIVLVSGIYVFVLFETSIVGAYRSVEYMTHEQWYLAGVMRSLHRYASDAAVITLLLHMLREFVRDRYRGPRWFSWFTGIPLLWLVFPLGITGYWMVWDTLAQYLAIASAELLDALPVFSDPMARNFLTNDSLSDRFFTLLAFLHLIGLPVFLVFGIWFHLLRISHAQVNPPRTLMLGSLLALTLLSLLLPAVSQAPADLGKVATGMAFDWFYLPVYPLLDIGSPALVWGLLIGSSLFFSILPWLPRMRLALAARVDLLNCNGCGRCVDDCPYNAVTMGPRTDGLSYAQQAVVDADLCTRCGICAGACPTSTPYRRRSELVPGIELPGQTVASLREQTLAASAALRGEQRIVVYACENGTSLDALRSDNVAVIALPCVAMLPPSFLDLVITRGHADGVLLLGCREGDCRHRLGSTWMEQRLSGARDPQLRKRVPLARIARLWQGWAGLAAVRAELEVLRARLRTLGKFRHTAAGTAHEDKPGAAP